ncbi:MAG: HAMP domain-containing histidine kinase [Rhizobiaceae bacterium]|nr:HAMP domain-containing histidine kinase [Rhizobiaceae bacterium]
MSSKKKKSAITTIAEFSSRMFANANIAQCEHKAPASLCHELDSDLVLQNMKANVSCLNGNGTWMQVAGGSCEYFNSIDTKCFREWVNSTVHVQDRVVVLKAVSDCEADDKTAIEEFRVLNSSSFCEAPLWVEIRCVPVPRRDSVLIFLEDISTAKSLEIEMLAARDLADKANLAKSRFLANMSHELRTPLNAIIGFSEILKSGMLPANNGEKQQEYHGLINDSAQHLLQVVNDILDISKIEAGKYEIHPEELDLTQIISSCCSMMYPLAKNREVSLHICEQEKVVLLEADSKALRQILLNLLSNAIKFSKRETTIYISAVRVGRMVELKVTDQGDGISNEHLEGLGEPFHQIDGEKSRRHEGTGLGLSIVKGLAQLHGGSLKIESQLGSGTTVCVQLSQSLGLSYPVPADDSDTVIRIKPANTQMHNDRNELSRMVR